MNVWTDALGIDESADRIAQQMKYFSPPSLASPPAYTASQASIYHPAIPRI